MQNYNSINLIIKNNLCISCGACKHICPFNNIVMEYAQKRAKWDAKVCSDEICLKCNGLKNCLDVCPSYNNDYTKYSSMDNDFLGQIEQVYNGYSNNINTRNNSSSGGFIRELCLSVLKNNIATKVISLTHDSNFEYTPKSINDISLMPNSIYHNINYENAFEIIKKYDEKFLIIGLPCQIFSINKLLSKGKFKKFQERIVLKVALMCGCTYDRFHIDYLNYSNKIKANKISYRENGRFRKTRLESRDKNIVLDLLSPKCIKDYINIMIMSDVDFAQKGCFFCVDHMGYSADLVVGDAWQNRYQKDLIGTNIIIVRTKIGKDVIGSIGNFQFEEGYINEIIESQGVFSKPFLGLLNKQDNIFNDEFLPIHSIGSYDCNKFANINLKEKIKKIYLKKMIAQKRFILFQICYYLLELKAILKFIIKRILRLV